MRVLFAMDSFPFYGTSESLLFATALRKRGNEVLVCTSNRSADGKLTSRHRSGVPTIHFPSFRMPGLPYLVTPGSLPEMLLAIRDFNPDVVLAMHYVHFTTNMAVLASRMSKKPTFLGIRGPGTSFGGSKANALKKTLSRTIGKATIGLSDLVIFDCFASRRAYDWIPDWKSEVVYSPVDSTRFIPEPKTGGPVTITYVGSLTPTKGVIFLLLAIPRVLEQFPSARVWIVGDGISRRALEAVSPRNVRFFGYRSDVREILNESDIVVLPSLSEGVSNSLLEAGACGKACVASNVGGSPEIIDDGTNGFLVPPMDPAALSTKLLQLCGESQLREEFGRKLRKKVEAQFDLEQIASKLEFLIRRACG